MRHNANQLFAIVKFLPPPEVSGEDFKVNFEDFLRKRDLGFFRPFENELAYEIFRVSRGEDEDVLDSINDDDVGAIITCLTHCRGAIHVVRTKAKPKHNEAVSVHKFAELRESKALP